MDKGKISWVGAASKRIALLGGVCLAIGLLVFWAMSQWPASGKSAPAAAASKVVVAPSYEQFINTLPVCGKPIHIQGEGDVDMGLPVARHDCWYRLRFPSDGRNWHVEADPGVSIGLRYYYPNYHVSGPAHWLTGDQDRVFGVKEKKSEYVDFLTPGDRVRVLLWSKE